MGIDDTDKIDLINVKISNLDAHISVLSEDILNNPGADVDGKPTRQSVLEDFELKKNALILIKQTLTNQG